MFHVNRFESKEVATKRLQDAFEKSTGNTDDISGARLRRADVVVVAVLPPPPEEGYPLGPLRFVVGEGDELMEDVRVLVDDFQWAARSSGVIVTAKEVPVSRRTAERAGVWFTSFFSRACTRSGFAPAREAMAWVPLLLQGSRFAPALRQCCVTRPGKEAELRMFLKLFLKLHGRSGRCLSAYGDLQTHKVPCHTGIHW